MHDYDLVATTESAPPTDEAKGLFVVQAADVEQDGYCDAVDDLVVVTTPRDVWNRTLFPDTTLHFYGTPLVDGPAATKLLKFLVTTALLIVIMFHVVRIMDWEHKADLKLADLCIYQSPLIVQDAIVFFVVGRLFQQQRGIDHLVWVGTCLAANVFSSTMTRFRFLQHSFTLYEIHCQWPWQLFVFVLVVAPVVVGIILCHVHRAVQQGIFVSKLLELVLALALFLVPYLPSKYLHLHHWYVGWLVGMHFNFDVWWSRVAMAWCWGLYVNGIAAYAHDPVLTCGYSYWLSEHMRCPYLQCYLEELEHPTAQNDTHHVHPMVTPDWRNCSADSYHP